jgi:hypothetical protein
LIVPVFDTTADTRRSIPGNNDSLATNAVSNDTPEFEIEILGEPHPAKLTRQAFYDPPNQRLRS